MRLTVTPDLNVLLAASRSDHPQHAAALSWMEDAVSECATGGSIEVLPMVAAGFLRLSTNPKVFPSPTPIRAAIDFIDSLLAIPGVEMPELGREWPTLRELASAHNLSANDLTDAWIAAAVRTIGSHLVTFDRGFARLLGRGELTVLSPTRVVTP
jgi:toxin-antitoxin system PIN domain toxin